MKNCFFYLLFIWYFSSCGEDNRQSYDVQSKDSAALITTDSITQIDTSPKTDFHTTYTDVIDNLFVFINKKNWTTVKKFYANSPEAAKHGSYFKSLFESKQLKELELVNTSKKGDEVYVTTRAKKLNDSQTQMCFLFHISDNRIIEQKETPCQ